jgi:hypothetical protein
MRIPKNKKGGMATRLDMVMESKIWRIDWSIPIQPRMKTKEPTIFTRRKAKATGIPVSNKRINVPTKKSMTNHHSIFKLFAGLLKTSVLLA